jgi:RimJ/RimL family protein N-acetyltransferase
MTTKARPTQVTLRAVESSDLATLYQQQSDPEANRMAVVNPRDEESFHAHWAKILVDSSVVARAILLDGALVGTVNCFKMDGDDAVGYWIAREHWGRGIATRALGLLLEEVAIRPLYARAARSNVASVRVLENCGFVVTGYQLTPATDRFPECEEARLILELRG